MKRFLANLLVVVLGSLAGYGATAVVMSGCGSWLQSYDEVNDPRDDVGFAKCRTMARAEKQITGSGDKAEAVYFACTDDAGLPRPTGWSR
jgi:hypothetical protein